MSTIAWTALMKISGVTAPLEPGMAPNLKLTLSGGIDPELLAALACMMRAPVVRITIEQLQHPLFHNVDPETGEIV